MQEAEAFERDLKINLLRKYAFPIYTRHKLNAHKMFRRHPEHLVNLFCTVNLHPVSMELIQLFDPQHYWLVHSTNLSSHFTHISFLKVGISPYIYKLHSV